MGSYRSFKKQETEIILDALIFIQGKVSDYYIRILEEIGQLHYTFINNKRDGIISEISDS